MYKTLKLAARMFSKLFSIAHHILTARQNYFQICI